MAFLISFIHFINFNISLSCERHWWKIYYLMINMLLYKYVSFNIQKKRLDGRIIFELLVYTCLANLRFSNMFVKTLITKKPKNTNFHIKNQIGNVIDWMGVTIYSMSVSGEFCINIILIGKYLNLKSKNFPVCFFI